jgi:superfamily II DNA/RNA helicase
LIESALGKGTGKILPKDSALPYHHLAEVGDSSLDLTSYPEINSKTRESLAKNGITTLFPIQAQTFRLIYEGKDVLARDLTGSGKTLAFALPLVERFRKEGLFDSR